MSLAAIPLKLCARVEDLAKYVLDANDLVPDGKLPADFGLEQGGGRQVIGVRMGFQQPIHRRTLLILLGLCH